MTTRRDFIKIGAVGGAALTPLMAACAPQDAQPVIQEKPIVVSTWEHGLAANEAAWGVLSTGGRALDAAEQGVRVTESDPSVTTVGLGGRPDRTGRVTLDACIMNEVGDCGSVAALEHIENPISVARAVMERTPHVMLVGAGALAFAREQGFPETNLLTPASEAAWRAWQARGDTDARAEINVENHDTIGLLTLDDGGNLSGACTTSGAAWKLYGRVGDSPIIGAGLYVDNDVGGACATGWGEAVVRIVGCHLVVEFMRQGLTPEDACRQAVDRVIQKNPDYAEIQVGFLALNKAGAHGSYCIQPGFNYAVRSAAGSQLLDAPSHL